MTKKINKNPKYDHVKSSLDTGKFVSMPFEGALTFMTERALIGVMKVRDSIVAVILLF